MLLASPHFFCSSPCDSIADAADTFSRRADVRRHHPQAALRLPPALLTRLCVARQNGWKTTSTMTPIITRVGTSLMKR